MPDPFRKVRSGENFRPSAAQMNAWTDAAIKARNSRYDTAARHVADSRSTILVRNDSGDDRERFDVLSLTGIVIDPGDNDDAELQFQDRVTLIGDEPTDAYRGRFAILAEPIPDGQLGRAYLDGVCPARIKGAGSAGDTADVEDGEVGWLLVQAGGAATILWEPGGSGERWAVVRLGTATRPILIGICCTEYNAYDTVTVEVVDGLAGADPTGSGVTVSARAPGVPASGTGTVGVLLPVGTAEVPYHFIPLACAATATC